MRPRILTLALTVAFTTIPAIAPAQTSEPKPVVAVFDIAIDGFKMPDVTVKRLTKYLGVRLMMGGAYQTIPEMQLKEAMVSLKLESQKDCYDEMCRVKLGQEAAANKNLNVTVWKVGSKCSIIGALYDLRAAASEEATEVKNLNCNEEGIKQGIEQFAMQLGGRKGQPQQTAAPEALPPPPRMTTSASVDYGSGDAPPVKDESGYLSVEGSPKGARVDISGPKSFGTGGKAATSLPVRPFQVPAGEYRVSVSMTGYDTVEQSRRVYADRTETVTVELVLSTGQIQISGKPEGAKSRLECQKGFVRDFGLPSASSPWTVTVPRGSCRLTAERDGYEKYDEVFAVPGGGVANQTVELKFQNASRGSGYGPGARALKYSNDSVLADILMCASTDMALVVIDPKSTLGSGKKPGEVAFCIDKYELMSGDKPRGGLSSGAASGACKKAGKKLCSGKQWQKACSNGTPAASNCNISGGLKKSGSNPKCVTNDGVFDMIGNVGEVTSDREVRGGDVTGGGSGCDYSSGKHFLPKANDGARCCMDPEYNL